MLSPTKLVLAESEIDGRCTAARKAGELAELQRCMAELAALCNVPFRRSAAGALMFGFRRIRKADIPAEHREIFERYGETVIQMIAAGGFQPYDLARDRANIRVSVLSPTGLDPQIGHEGATWLDRELMSRQRGALADQGFGREVKAALEKRKQVLVNRGHATDLGEGHIRSSERRSNGWKPSTSSAPERRSPPSEGGHGNRPSPATTSGTLVGSAQLSSGRFAMIESFSGDGGLGFSLVPWRPALEQHIGRHVSGIAMPGGGVDWLFGRKRGLGL